MYLALLTADKSSFYKHLAVNLYTVEADKAGRFEPVNGPSGVLLLRLHNNNCTRGWHKGGEATLSVVPTASPPGRLPKVPGSIPLVVLADGQGQPYLHAGGPLTY